MVFKWKIPMSVSADDAERELTRIYDETGSLDPQAVVDASRAEGAPLHGLFEWDDSVAAEKYRITQARFIIRNIVKDEKTDGPSVTVRKFVHVDAGYMPIKAVMSNEELRKSLIESAFADMEAFRAKYRALSELAAVFDAMESIKAALP